MCSRIKSTARFAPPSLCEASPIKARQDNPEYARWLAIYEKRADPNAHGKVCEMCVFSLQERIEQFCGDGVAHAIDPGDFLVEQMD